MNKFISLTKIQIIDFFSKYARSMNTKNKFLGILVIFLPIILILPAYQIVTQLYNIFSTINAPELTITYIYIANTIFIFFIGIAFIISVFFYSKDLRLISTLPVKEDTIVFSKLTSVYIYLFVISCFFLGTSIVIYSTIGELKLISLIIGIIALLISPLLPMILSTIIILPFMSLVGSGKKRNLLIIVGNLLFIGGIVVMQTLLTRMQMDPEQIRNILLQEDGLLIMLGRNFPPSIWLTKMIQGSIPHAILFLAINAIFILILKVLAKGLYRRTLMKFNQEQAVIQGGKIYYKKRNKGLQIIKRHINIIISNPIFLLNTLLTIFLPIFMGVIFLFTGELDGSLFKSTILEPYQIYIYSAIITSPAVMGSLSATAITREGKAFWQTKVLPISTRDNIRYRIYTTLIISFFASLVLGIIAVYFISVNLMTVLISSIFCISATLFLSVIDIIINIERPLLNWSSPTAAVKNNLNIILSLLIRVVIGVIVYFAYIIISAWEASIIMILFSGFFIILYFISKYIIRKIYEDKFIDIAP